MASYKLTIKSKTETIELNSEREGKPEISSVEFKMNTLDDNTRNRDEAVRAEFRIKGMITKENGEVTNQLAKWAMDHDAGTLYRNVELLVDSGTDFSGKTLRRYKFDEMFVIDYTESFGLSEANSDSGTYELFIAQKENTKGKQEVFPR